MEDFTITVTHKRESDRVRANKQITVAEVRLIDFEGNQVGVVSTPEALRMATEAGYDLVEISPTASPPVCKIMDHGKHLFDLSKNKIKKPRNDIKELKFRPTTDRGDYEVKLRNLKRFLSDGNKVKITLRFRGREAAHQDIGMELMQRLQVDVQDFAVVEQSVKREGRQLLMVLAPKKK